MGLWGIRVLGGCSELFGGFVFGAVLVFALAVNQPSARGQAAPEYSKRCTCSALGLWSWSDLFLWGWVQWTGIEHLCHLLFRRTPAGKII